MDEILDRIKSIEAKLDLLLTALAEEVDDVPGDEHGLERDSNQTL